MITVPTSRQTATALRILAHLVDAGQIRADEDRVKTEHAIGGQLARQIADGMTDLRTEDWTGESGWRYRDYTGRLLGLLPVRLLVRLNDDGTEEN